jgi:hypothetical protein
MSSSDAETTMKEPLSLNLCCTYVKDASQQFADEVMDLFVGMEGISHRAIIGTAVLIATMRLED